jgi:hypothetical protein
MDNYDSSAWQVMYNQLSVDINIIMNHAQFKLRAG